MSEAETIAAPQIESLGSMIDRHFAIEQRRSALQKEADELKKEAEELGEQIIALLDKQDLTIGRGRKSAGVVSESEVPVVEDWDAFYADIVESNRPYLLERRPALTVWRELHAAGETPKGTRPFTKRTFKSKKA